MFAVYILFSPNIKKFYHGQTNDLERRMYRHNGGFEKSTARGRPWILIWATTKKTRSEAVGLERKLKNLSQKRLIELMMKYNGDVQGADKFLLLKQMSEC